MHTLYFRPFGRPRSSRRLQDARLYEAVPVRYDTPSATAPEAPRQDCRSDAASCGTTTLPSAGRPLRLSRRANESLRFPALALAPAPTAFPGVPCACPATSADGPAPAVGAPAAAFAGVASPGTTPASDRLAISARTALNHLISSSSLGAQRSTVRLVVTILNVCWPCAPTPSPMPANCWGGDALPAALLVGT